MKSLGEFDVIVNMDIGMNKTLYFFDMSSVTFDLTGAKSVKLKATGNEFSVCGLLAHAK